MTQFGIRIHSKPFEPIHTLCQGGFGCGCWRMRQKEFQRKHGTRSCYHGGCRCPECTAANTAYQSRYNRRRGYAAAGA